MQVTKDTFFDGKLCIYQPLQGYRSSVDALLLSYFASQGRRVLKALDIGSGSGLIGLSLLLSDQAEFVTAVEIQPELSKLAQKNSVENGFSSRFEMLNSDLRSLPQSFFDSARYGLIVMNPPFWPQNHRLPKHPQKRIACHELNGSIVDWIKLASRVVEPRRGRICIVFPSFRLNSLYKALSRHRLSCVRLQFIHPLIDRDAELVLVEARPRTSPQLRILPPLVLKSLNGHDTEIASRIIKGTFHPNISSIRDRR